jgi:4-hydroxy-tetrahydrodipicolinate synthase
MAISCIWPRYSMGQRRVKVGKPRLPLTPPDEKSAAAIEDMLKRYKIDLPLG